MARTIWEPCIMSMDYQTCFMYCTSYRDGNFYLEYYYDADNEWTLYYSKIYDFEFEDLILKRGFKTVSSAKRYFTKNLSNLLDKVDRSMYGD